MNGHGTTTPHRLTREQRIVDHLVGAIPLEASRLTQVEARSQALPALLRRHGPVQVILFLAAKGGNGNGGLSDRDLAEWLVQGVAAALELPGTGERPDLGTEAERLARMELAGYLLRWEIALEVAGWLKMIIGARLEESKQRETVSAGDSAQ